MPLENYRADAMRCTRCAYCKWIPLDKVKSWRFAKGCPSIEYAHFHSYSAGGRLITALSLMDGRSTVTGKVKDSVFKCNLCGSCDVTCKMCRYDMEPLLAMRELRAHLVREGHTLPQVETVIKGLRLGANMLGAPPAQRGDWAAELKVKNLATSKSELVFHAGCRYSFDGELSNIARASVRILQGRRSGCRHPGRGGNLLRRARPRPGLHSGIRDALAFPPQSLEAGGRQDRGYALLGLLLRIQAPVPS